MGTLAHLGLLLQIGGESPPATAIAFGVFCIEQFSG
jgi:hypothetical protein